MSEIVFTGWGNTLMPLLGRQVEGVHFAGVYFTPVLERNQIVSEAFTQLKSDSEV
jgi:hypothetical protein